jgi:hypothetical protein
MKSEHLSIVIPESRDTISGMTNEGVVNSG